LTSSKDQIYSSYDIENFVFDDDLSNNKRVRNLISRLRLKLKIQLVENIYGEGYRLKWLK
jgi:DNA-binding response OmpR family regulator